MVTIKLPTFAGMVPSLDEHLLGNENASFAQDVWLYSGALAGIPKQVELHELVNPDAAIAFRVPLAMSNAEYIYQGGWVEFEDPLTDFISAPVAGDSFRRYYFTSPTQEPRYNTLQRIQNGDPPFLLGLPQAVLISVNAAGGSSTTQVSRAYVATLVSAYGEEGPASTPILINGKVDDTFTVTIGGVNPDNLGVDRNVTKIRLYRTIVSAAGTVTYYRITEVDALSTSQTYDDVTLDAALASRPILESTAWTAPPNLDGFTVMPNGIVAGYKDNELWFSEAYRPHAWPAAYSLTLEHAIVGLAVIGQTLVVCTKGNPYTASGVNPASISTSKLAAFEPCLWKGSILPTEDGVYFTSPNGLILVNSGYAQNITKQFATRDQWKKVVNSGRVNAARLGGAYYGFGSGVSRFVQDDAFQTDAFQTFNDDGATDGFLIDPSNANMGFTYLKDTVSIKSVLNDMYSGEAIVVKDGYVYLIDQSPDFEMEPYIWRSKVFQTPEFKNFSAYKIYFYPLPGFVFPNPPNYDINQVFDPNTQIGIVRVFADGQLVHAGEFRVQGELERLPSGYKAEFWQVEIEARVRVKSFQMATSTKELSGV